MTRKKILMHTVTQYLRYNNQGAHKQRQLSRFVLTKIIEDFYCLRAVPPTWYAINATQVSLLVEFWKKNGLQNATIMNYLVCLRAFLRSIDHVIDGIDNPTLHLTKSGLKPKPIIDRDKVLAQLTDPIACIQFALQSHFGLTFYEAIQIIPVIHITDNTLWVTREISSNSKDRFIPIQSKVQLEIIIAINELLKPSESLKARWGEGYLKLAYQYALKTIGLSTNIQYRYLYAKARLQESSNSPKKLTISIIKQEMSITAASTIWSYCRE